ncbi:MAG: hypothetical protein JO018_06090 [Candidatus Eremiobacteraeota bacterium]|nr:hypothetical protein [Candidatus Eremiobacteraeota bacterium]
MLRSTLREDFGPYLRRDFLRVLDFLRPPDFLLLDERRFELLDFFLGILLLAFSPPSNESWRSALFIPKS